MTAPTPKTREEWLKALDDLPSSTKIPAFFFAHASPIIEILEAPGLPMSKNGALPQFLKDFGKSLVEKYNPKAIVVFSAHWDADGTQLGTQRFRVILAICSDFRGLSQ